MDRWSSRSGIFLLLVLAATAAKPTVDARDALRSPTSRPRSQSPQVENEHPTGSELRTMGSRRKPVLGVSFSPDGRWLGTLSIDSISLWDLASGLQSLTLHGDYKGGPNGIVFGQDAGWIAAVSGEKNAAKLWDPRSGNELSSLPVKTGGLLSPVAFSADGRLLAAQGEGCCAVKVWETTTGNELQTLPGHIMGITALGFTPEGRLLASGSMEGAVKIWDVAAGRELNTLNLNSGLVMALFFSPDGKWLATTSSADANVRVWDVASGQELHSFSSAPGNTAVAFSPDGRLLAAYGTSNTIELWEAATGRSLGTLSGNTGAATALSFSPDGHYLVSGTADGAVAVWEMPKGDQLLSLISTTNGTDWLVIAPDGLFDGSPAAWEEILWRPNNDALDVWPVEIFFNEYFYPELLADVLAGKHPKATTNINQIDRRQPVIAIEPIAPLPANGVVSTREIKLRVQVTEAPADKDHPRGGVQDLRLFRNGSLVQRWHALPLDQQGRALLESKVQIIAGENQFTAYAFNNDNIKSSDATFVVTGAVSPPRKGTAHILAIGVNQYANSSFDLRYAVADARAFAQQLKEQQEKLGIYEHVQVNLLLDAQATQANILAAFSSLAQRKSIALPSNTPPELAQIKSAQPEDAVFVYFAGHGMAQGARFYLVPHDQGYTGGRDAIDAAAMETLIQHSISDEALDRAFEGIDAGRIVLVIDACNSGQALESDEKRRGPMNSKGLAQLAYEKGMYILTAAQGFQQAQEISRLGHGLLTYALVEEGLKDGNASNGDGVVHVRDWLDYAAQEVPQLQRRWLAGELKSERGVNIKAANSMQLGLQRPRVFYRRGSESSPLIIGKRTPASAPN